MRENRLYLRLNKFFDLLKISEVRSNLHHLRLILEVRMEYTVRDLITIYVGYSKLININKEEKDLLNDGIHKTKCVL